MNAFTNPRPMTSTKTGPDMPAMQMPQAFLLFNLGAKTFGLDAGKVRELLQYEALTKLADGEQVVEDVVVWRGNVVPVVDMRVRFNFGTPLYEARTCVIILEVGGRYIGMAVDSVAELVTLAPEQVKPLPSGAATAASCLLGTAMHDGGNLILVDIDKLMGVAGVAASQKLS